MPSNFDLFVLNPDWVGPLIVVGGIVVVILLGVILNKGAAFRTYSRGVGNAFFEIEALLRPSRVHIRDAKGKQRKVEEEKGGPDKAGPNGGT